MLAVQIRQQMHVANSYVGLPIRIYKFICAYVRNDTFTLYIFKSLSLWSQLSYTIDDLAYYIVVIIVIKKLNCQPLLQQEMTLVVASHQIYRQTSKNITGR